MLDTEIDLVKLRKAVAEQQQSLVAAAVRSTHKTDNTEPMHAPAAGPGNKRKLPPKARAAAGASGPGRRNSKAAAAAAAAGKAGTPGRRAAAPRPLASLAPARQSQPKTKTVGVKRTAAAAVGIAIAASGGESSASEEDEDARGRQQQDDDEDDDQVPDHGPSLILPSVSSGVGAPPLSNRLAHEDDDDDDAADGNDELDVLVAEIDKPQRKRFRTLKSKRAPHALTRPLTTPRTVKVAPPKESPAPEEPAKKAHPPFWHKTSTK